MATKVTVGNQPEDFIHPGKMLDGSYAIVRATSLANTLWQGEVVLRCGDRMARLRHPHDYLTIPGCFPEWRVQPLPKGTIITIEV